MDVILASGSPRRKELLEMLGVKNLRVIPAQVNEDALRGLSASELVKELSLKKCSEIANKSVGDCVIIGADTVVELDGEILGKPKSEADAADMLRKLSNRRHTVHTGVTVIRGDTRVSEAERTAVEFRAVSETEIAAYIKTGEPMDKSGSYGAQGIGALFITGIEGDFFNVMGLPVCRLGIILNKLGVSLL
jgi:septum formation protein